MKKRPEDWRRWSMIITAKTKQSIEQSVKKILHDVDNCSFLRIMITSKPEEATTICCAFEKVVKEEPDRVQKRAESVQIEPECAQNEEKSQEPEKPKKEWSKKQKADIDAIKNAVKAQKAKKEADKKRKTARADLNDDEIVRLRDEEGLTWKEIGKKLKCAPQTAVNRYVKVKVEKENS